MTLQQCVEELENDTKSAKDVECKIVAAGHTLTCRYPRSQTCPVAQYLSNKIGQRIVVNGTYACEFSTQVKVLLPGNITQFVREFDRSLVSKKTT